MDVTDDWKCFKKVNWDHVITYNYDVVVIGNRLLWQFGICAVYL